jgi:hypothetical protein
MHFEDCPVFSGICHLVVNLFITKDKIVMLSVLSRHLSRPMCTGTMCTSVYSNVHIVLVNS